MISTETPIVLAVMDAVRRKELIRQIEEQGLRVLAVSRCAEARAILRRNPPVPMVLTDETLPDGDWRDVLQAVAASGVRAEIVVCAGGSEQSLTLSFELLDHGAFGLMAEPYDSEQLQWLINAARARSKTALRRSVPREIASPIDVPGEPVASA